MLGPISGPKNQAIPIHSVKPSNYFYLKYALIFYQRQNLIFLVNDLVSL
jgi:hypothetical protein